MTESATADTLSKLGGRLTDREDRETYAALVSYFRSLPPSDELFQLAELLGLLSLIGQRVPEAVSELLAELREQTKTSAEYHSQVDQRLSRLPEEIAAGVNIEAIAKSMSEAFRQQLTATGLQEVTTFLSALIKDTRNVTVEMSAAFKPIRLEYKSISSLISVELAKLRTASRQLEEHNRNLMQRERSRALLLTAMLAILLFLIGGLCGIVFEKRQAKQAVIGLDVEDRRPKSLPAPIKQPKVTRLK